uniref:GATA zinc finger domain-containing protein 14-like n=1 Tax=Dermatophagoides pteronyssinus TaxID=6956 RepID=A0A6P6YC41_DERPT|nr:GATA zinc finger domain-containing protein 14-like [Dermatophagoides pteronyssinus]
MFGNNNNYHHHYHRSNSKEFKSNICDDLLINNGDDDEKLNNGDSVSDLESIESLNLQDVDSQPMKFLNRSSHQTTTKSYSSPTSPKIMISTCNDSKLIINQNIESNNNKSIVRVIKPTAIHPNINYFPPRPSTSVGLHNSGLIEPSSSSSQSNHSSAFHQVLSHHRQQQQSSKSNSLSEPLLMIVSNPYSNPISMENIEHNDNDNDDDNDVTSTINHVDEEKSLRNYDHHQQEPIHMTLEEVRRIAFGSPERRLITRNSHSSSQESRSFSSSTSTTANVGLNKSTSGTGHHGLHNAKIKIKNFMDTLLNKTTPCINGGGHCSSDYSTTNNVDHSSNISSSSSPPITQNNLNSNIRRRRHTRRQPIETTRSESQQQQHLSSPFIQRALPPVPATNLFIDHNNNNNDDNDNGSDQIITTDDDNHHHHPMLRYRSSLQMTRSQLKSMSEYERQKYLDYVSSIERVKNCGWYWGPISGEMAEKLLESEPCGSFLVRDSSDEHYIFSLSFKLDEMVRHVRIEQEQGNFSFGSLKKFRSSTIVDFIESAMEHSRSGQFLFFLRLGPELGPIRVQLLYPVSRFKRVQSLQHICRFVILQFVRRDQIHQLSLPEYLRHYLDTPYYYSEELARMQTKNEINRQDEQQHLLDMKRKLFLQTDYQTLISKMLINRLNLEKKLSINLPVIEPLDNFIDDTEDIDETKENNSTTDSVIHHDNNNDDNHDQQHLL